MKKDSNVLIFSIFLSVFAILAISVGELKNDEPKGALQEFFDLNKKLPKAICNDDFISRTPSLSIESSDSKIGSIYFLSNKVTEAEVISFLMEDQETLIAPKAISDQWDVIRTSQAASSKELIESFKRKISVEVCNSVVVPGKIESTIEKDPGRFFSLGRAEQVSPKKGEAIFQLQDIKSRFGIFKKKWWVAGWLEPYEVRFVNYGSRSYHRIADPVTNQRFHIQIMGLNGIPLGYLYPSSEPAKFDWKRLWEESDSDRVLKEKFKIYRKLIEIHAHEALQLNRVKLDAIRKLQEGYKNIIDVYRLLPDHDQFKTYSRKTRKIGLESIKKIFDIEFQISLKQARSNGIGIGLAVFRPDETLQKIFLEYQDRLKKLVR